jgi:hypothetical protein
MMEDSFVPGGVSAADVCRLSPYRQVSAVTLDRCISPAGAIGILRGGAFD